MKVAFVHHAGRMRRLSGVELGESPTEFFYGAIELARRGVKVTQYEVNSMTENRVVQTVGGLIPRHWTPVKTDAGLFDNVRRILDALNDHDCVVATAGNIAFALAGWGLTGALRKPLIGIQCGLLDYRHGWWRKWISKRLLLSMSTILFGDAELLPMRRMFSIPKASIEVNQFGVDAEFWTPSTEQVAGEYVLAVGSDGRRDYETLCAAAFGFALPVKIVTRIPLPEVLPSNVTVVKGSWHQPAVNDVELRELYRNAASVIVSLKETLQPSGQSVTLQAMSCGRPVILTKTMGLWKQDMLEHGRNVLLASAGMPAELTDHLRLLTSDPGLAKAIGIAARNTVLAQATIGRFAENMESICRRVAVKSES